MADKQTSPDAVHITRTSKFHSGNIIGPLGQTFVTSGDVDTSVPRVKAIWRNEVGPFNSAHTKATPQ